MGLDFPVDQQIISAQEDFGHYVSFVAEVFHGGFGSQIVEAEDSGLFLFGAGVVFETGKPLVHEVQGNFPAGNDLVRGMADDHDTEKV